jgi:hypothetical protein
MLHYATTDLPADGACPVFLPAKNVHMLLYSKSCLINFALTGLPLAASLLQPLDSASAQAKHSLISEGRKSLLLSIFRSSQWKYVVRQHLHDHWHLHGAAF